MVAFARQHLPQQLEPASRIFKADCIGPRMPRGEIRCVSIRIRDSEFLFIIDMGSLQRSMRLACLHISQWQDEGYLTIADVICLISQVSREAWRL